MAAYKQFLSSDVIVTPFEVNKGFTFNSSSFGDPDVQIFTYEGKNSDPVTQVSQFNGIQRNLLYNSIKQLYYSNYLSSSTGDMPVSASILPGETPEGNVLRGPSSSTGRYYNYLDSSLTSSRYFPTESDSEIAVFSIPSRLFGDYVQPESFVWEDNTHSVTYTDDGEGNIISSQLSEKVGNIIYQHGMVIITDGQSLSVADITQATNVTCSFSSSLKIFETQYKATISEFEYNFSQNPSIISGSTDGSVYDFTTGSFFQPYVTTVGLYNEAQELLAVGKLSQPYPLSRTTDTTFYINIDR
jgi:hypothetical protein